ncbi:MAG: HlyD family efflux transporter periplasmic adaptor subunit [Roseiflexaceae bacterium]
MNRKLSVALCLLLLLFLLPLLAACGAPAATAQQEPPTPTPLPPDPALERPTYKVARGTIERVLEVNGRITPVDLVRLAFHRSGRVNTVKVARGDVVKAGDVLAELQQDDALDELRQAEDTLVQAKRDLADAQKAQAKKIKQAQLGLENAQEDLKRLLPGGDDDPIRKAQLALEQAQRERNKTDASGSETKTGAEYALLKAAEAVQDAQKAYSAAWWDNDWVEKYGTDPVATEPISGSEKLAHRKLTDREKEEFKTKLTQAERTLREAERGVVQAQRDLDEARQGEIDGNKDSDVKVQDAQRELDRLLNGKGSKEIIDARRAVDDAQLELEEARQESFNAAQKQVENAQRALEKARKKVEDGRVIAPQAGEVLVLSIGEGDQAEEFDPVIEIADPSNLEAAVELGGDQMRQLAEGQPAEVSLLSRPDVIMPSVIRLMPAPYGSGGSGAVQEQDRTTRIHVEDTKGQELAPGSVAKIRIVLESKKDALWLPPEAVRAFEGRRFVVVREGERERRVTVKVGIETEDRAEITEGVEEGDVIVGQ